MAFTNDDDPELIVKSANVVQAFTPESYAYLISLIPTPEGVQTDHNNYATSYAGLLAGDPEKAKECELHRQAVNQGLSILVGLAKAVTIRDPKVPELLRLPTPPAKATASSAPLTQPTGFKVVFTPDGLLVATVTAVKNARGYQVWACDDDPNLESNWRLVASSPSSRKIVITGLDRGKNNWLKARAMTGKGQAGPWSNFVNLCPI